LLFYQKVQQFPHGRCDRYARFKEGLCHLRLGDPKEALDRLYRVLVEKGLLSAPLAPAARRALVEAYSLIGDPRKARGFFLRTGTPDAVRAMLSDLSARYRRGMDDKSAVLIEKEI